MSDPCDRLRRTVVLGLACLACACQPLNPAQPPVAGGDGGTPCTLATAVHTDTIAVVGGACNPWCVTVSAASSVSFLNQDQVTYLFDTPGPAGFEMVLPPLSGAQTPPLPAGTTVLSAVHWPAASVTIFAE